MWLNFRFNLSYRDVEELLVERGIAVSYKTIRQWTRKFAQTYANQLRRWRAQPGDKWHLDEVFLKINGKKHYMRAMPLLQESLVLARQLGVALFTGVLLTTVWQLLVAAAGLGAGPGVVCRSAGAPA